MTHQRYTVCVQLHTDLGVLPVTATRALPIHAREILKDKFDCLLSSDCCNKPLDIPGFHSSCAPLHRCLGIREHVCGIRDKTQVDTFLSKAVMLKEISATCHWSTSGEHSFTVLPALRAFSCMTV